MEVNDCTGTFTDYQLQLKEVLDPAVGPVYAFLFCVKCTSNWLNVHATYLLHYTHTPRG